MRRHYAPNRYLQFWPLVLDALTRKARRATFVEALAYARRRRTYRYFAA